MTAPSLPQGTRDFAPETVQKRNFILQHIRSVFELYGYGPLETPAMENLETLTGKYGEEGDKLIFKVLNNGLSDPKNREKAEVGFSSLLEGKSSALLTERALKYDLTIPFARFVATNANTLNFPFKRYQMQPVWRADRPQRGRYREFTQCDADVVGSNSLYNEAELCLIYHRALTAIGLGDYRLKINSRKILAALAEIAGGASQLIPITVAIDKLEKIGLEKVKAELLSKGLSGEQVEKISGYLNISGSNDEKLSALEKLFGENEQARIGLADLRFILSNAGAANLEIDLTLARGLNYYTGAIFEVAAPPQVKMGSIGGGGRYDDLTGLFGVPGISGVGISFGIDRIYDVMEELGLFPETVGRASQVIFFNLGEEEVKQARSLAEQLRDRGVASEVYPEQIKLDKQFRYADKTKIAFAVIIGSKELAEDFCTVKDLAAGKQETVPFEGLADFFTARNPGKI